MLYDCAGNSVLVERRRRRRRGGKYQGRERLVLPVFCFENLAVGTGWFSHRV